MCPRTQKRRPIASICSWYSSIDERSAIGVTRYLQAARRARQVANATVKWQIPERIHKNMTVWYSLLPLFTMKELTNVMRDNRTIIATPDCDKSSGEIFCYCTVAMCEMRHTMMTGGPRSRAIERMCRSTSSYPKSMDTLESLLRGQLKLDTHHHCAVEAFPNESRSNHHVWRGKLRVSFQEDNCNEVEWISVRIIYIYSIQENSTMFILKMFWHLGDYEWMDDHEIYSHPRYDIIVVRRPHGKRNEAFHCCKTMVFRIED